MIPQADAERCLWCREEDPGKIRQHRTEAGFVCIDVARCIDRADRAAEIGLPPPLTFATIPIQTKRLIAHERERA